MLDLLNAEHALPFVMLSTSFLVFSVLRKYLAPLKLSPYQHAILSYVRARGGCYRREILESLHICDDDRNNFVSMHMQIIDLADRELLERRPEQHDVRLEITPVGEAMLEAAQPLIEDARRELAQKMPPRRELLGPSAVTEAV